MKRTLKEQLLEFAHKYPGVLQKTMINTFVEQGHKANSVRTYLSILSREKLLELRATGVGEDMQLVVLPPNWDEAQKRIHVEVDAPAAQPSLPTEQLELAPLPGPEVPAATETTGTEVVTAAAPHLKKLQQLAKTYSAPTTADQLDKMLPEFILAEPPAVLTPATPVRAGTPVPAKTCTASQTPINASVDSPLDPALQPLLQKVRPTLEATLLRMLDEQFTDIDAGPNPVFAAMVLDRMAGLKQEMQARLQSKLDLLCS